MDSKEMTNKDDEQSTAFSWWWDNRNHPHRSQSQWLEATVSDLNEKTKLMLNIIEEDGDTFAQRAEMFYKRKPKLINMLQDLYKSHRSLAEKYDQLRSELIQASHLRSFSSLDALKVQTMQKCENDISVYMNDKLVLKPQVEEDQESYDGTEGKESDGVESEGNNAGEKEKIWDRKFTKLIDENVQQQAELIRRNKEKSESIERLLSQVHKLINENKSLKNQLDSYKLDPTTRPNQSQFGKSKSKGTSFIGRLAGCTG